MKQSERKFIKDSSKGKARLEITGDRRYIKRMSEHLRKEHPSTRKRMKTYHAEGKRNKFVRCVADVEQKQEHKRNKANPFAVCRTSTQYKGKTKNIGVREQFKSRKIPYRFHKKR